MSEWKEIEYLSVKRGEMFVVKGFGVRDGTYNTDPYCVWIDSGGEFVRWPHPFQPTHYMLLAKDL